MVRTTSFIAECWGFLRDNWVHFLFLVPATIGYTLIHEAMHVLAVTLQGGRLLEFVWLPSGDEWGHISYRFERDTYSHFLISIAPFLLSLALCTVGVALSFLLRPLNRWYASTIYFWLFLVPLADLACAAIPYCLSAITNDLFHAFGPPVPMVKFVAVMGGLAAAVLGFVVQKRLYRTAALSMPAYVTYAAVAAVLLLTVDQIALVGRT